MISLPSSRSVLNSVRAPASPAQSCCVLGGASRKAVEAPLERLSSSLHFFLHAVPDLAVRDLLERRAGRFLVPRLDLGGGAAVELAGALGGEDDQQVTVRDLVERLVEGGKRHQVDTSRSGRARVSRLVRHRSAWMI